MAGSFLTILERTQVRNYLIGVMDDETERYLIAKGNSNWFRVNLPVPKIQENSHPANRVREAESCVQTLGQQECVIGCTIILQHIAALTFASSK